MINGACQALVEGIIPGNRNLDNVDEALRKNDLLFYPSRSLDLDLKAVLLHSFGFGQANAQVLLINPGYLFSTLESSTYDSYCSRRTKRATAMYKFKEECLVGTRKYVDVKSMPPWGNEDADAVYLDPSWRISQNNDGKSSPGLCPRAQRLPRRPVPPNVQQMSAPRSACKW